MSIVRRSSPHDEVLALDLVVVVAARERLAIRRPDQERAEDVEDPAELLDDGGADQDERAAQDERDDDAHHQHFLLVAARHRELAHDQHEDEEVVDRQAVLGEPAGDELPGVLRSGEDPHESREDQRERDVEDDPQGRLPGRGDVRALEDEQQIGRRGSASARRASRSRTREEVAGPKVGLGPFKRGVR